MPARTSCVFLWRDRALFVGPPSVTARHAHHAVELSLALRGRLSYRSEAVALEEVEAGLVAPDVDHAIEISAPAVAIVYVDPESAWGAALAERAARSSGIVAPPVEPEAPERFLQLLRQPDLERAAQLCDELQGQVVARPPRRPPLDRRIRRLLESLADDGDDVTPADLAARCGLSATRFSHLFREQMGVTARRYLLWLRLRRALRHAFSGMNLTEAAHAAGFSDAAHFSRTCKTVFGLSPSEFAPVDGFFCED